MFSVSFFYSEATAAAKALYDDSSLASLVSSLHSFHAVSKSWLILDKFIGVLSSRGSSWSILCAMFLLNSHILDLILQNGIHAVPYQPPKQDFELGLLISFANRLTGSVQHELKLLFIILRLLFELLQSPSSGRPPFFDFFTLLAIYTTNPRLRPVSLLFIIFPQNYFRVFLIGPFYSLPVVFPLFGPLLWELFIKTTSCYRNLLMSFKCVIFDMQKPEVNMVIFVMFRGATWLQIRTFVWLLVLNRDRHFHLLWR